MHPYSRPLFLHTFQSVLWQIFYFYCHHAAMVKVAVLDPLFPSHESDNLLPVTEIINFDEKLLLHEDFMQMLSDFKLTGRIK
jgi:hypothetical protein